MSTLPIISIVLLLVSSVGAFGQDLPSPLDAWTEANGVWTFDGTDGGEDYVWRYSSHTFPRRVAFGFEQIAAPRLARDNVVAWAYSLDYIEPRDIPLLRNDIERMRVALALRHADDGTYYVLPATLADTVIDEHWRSTQDASMWVHFDDLSVRSSDQWTTWVISLSAHTYGVHDDRGVEWISSWNERPLPLDSESLPWTPQR